MDEIRGLEKVLLLEIIINIPGLYNRLEIEDQICEDSLKNHSKTYEHEVRSRCYYRQCRRPYHEKTENTLRDFEKLLQDPKPFFVFLKNMLGKNKSYIFRYVISLRFARMKDTHVHTSSKTCPS